MMFEAGTTKPNCFKSCVVLLWIFLTIQIQFFLSQQQTDYPNKNHHATPDVVKCVYLFEKLAALIELEDQNALSHLNL
jgi:hypothetical protein